MDHTTLIALENQAVVPLAAVGMAAFSYVCLHAAAWLKVKTKNEFISRVVGAAGRVAGDVSDKIAALPPGSDIAAVRSAAINEGVADVKDRVGDAVKKTGVNDGALAGIISGELGKLNAAKVPTPANPPEIKANA